MVIFYHEKREVIGCFQLLLLFFSWTDYFTAPFPAQLICRIGNILCIRIWFSDRHPGPHHSHRGKWNPCHSATWWRFLPDKHFFCFSEFFYFLPAGKWTGMLDRNAARAGGNRAFDSSQQYCGKCDHTRRKTLWHDEILADLVSEAASHKSGSQYNDQ